MALEDQQRKRRWDAYLRQEKRQKRKRFFKIAGIILAIVVLCALIGVLLVPAILPLFGIGEQPTEATLPIETQPDTVIHLIAGGDVSVTDKTVATGAAGSGYDYTEVFRDVLPVLSSADVTMLNFEGI